jgi:glutamyl-tRNA synthetase
LKDLCNVQLTSENTADFIGDDLSLIKKGGKIIHWVGEEAISARLQMPDGTMKEGRCEPIRKEDLDSVVQFERLGFVRIWAKNGGYEAYFAHR